MTTQRVSVSYQEVIDLHTESDKISVLGFHTPSNSDPCYLLRPFWDAYQKVRYRGCSMSLVPAARLPADPSQVSYEGGEQIIDPRDLLNPILFHGCHGDDLGSILNQFYSGEIPPGSDIERLQSDSTTFDQCNIDRIGNSPVYESLYYRALTDNTWLKAHPQRGFRKNMRPMVYRVAVNTPLNPGSVLNRYPTNADVSNSWDTVDDGIHAEVSKSAIGHNASNSYLSGSPMPGIQRTTGDATQGYTVDNPATYSHIQWMTPGIRPLGWIETRQPTSGQGSSARVTGSEQTDAQRIAGMYDSYNGRYCYIPKVFMGVCLLPPAYKTEQYFRVVLNHHFDFAKYRGCSMRSVGSQLSTVAPNVTNMYGEIDDPDDSKEVFDNGDSDKGVFDD